MVRMRNIAEQKRLIVCMLLMAFLSMFLMTGCGSEDKYVKLVKQGTMDMEPNVQIGRAFDKFFTDGKWKSFVATDNSRIVEFTGKCTWNNKPATCTIQFSITGEARFALGTVSINNVDMNRVTSRQIVDKALTGQRQ